MPSTRWFPMKHELPDQTKLGMLVASGDQWQLFRIDRENKLLAAKTSLAERWMSEGLISESIFLPFTFGDDHFVAIDSGHDLQLVPVNEFTSPETKMDALAFSVSLFETRKIIAEVSLHDSIYIEKFSRLLPTWTLSERVEDDEILGRWLTGGVSVSALSFRRLSSLLGWMSREDVRQVLDVGGFTVSSGRGGGLQTKTKTIDRTIHRKKEEQNAKDKRNQDQKNDNTEIDISVFRLHGRPELESFFNEHVIDIVTNEERYKAMGINFPSSIVLHGPPGCGKTFAVERLVEFLDWPIFEVDSQSVGSPYIHETSKKVSEVFEKAMDSAPSVIVIDEMESFLSDRQKTTGSHHVEEVAEFLRRIPEASTKQVLIIGMTNRLEMIDTAILRRGRFDHVIEVGMPSKEEVTELIMSLLEKIPVEPKTSPEKAIKSLIGRPLSDAAFAIREAARLAVRTGKEALDQDSLNTAVNKLPAVKDTVRKIGFSKE